MGVIFNQTALLKIPINKLWRCLICGEKVCDGDLLNHTKKCSVLKLKEDIKCEPAIRHHLMNYLFGLEASLVNGIDIIKYYDFILNVLRFICLLRFTYPIVPNYSKYFFQQELYIMESIHHSLLNFKIPFLPEINQSFTIDQLFG